LFGNLFTEPNFSLSQAAKLENIIIAAVRNPLEKSLFTNMVSSFDMFKGDRYN